MVSKNNLMQKAKQTAKRTPHYRLQKTVLGVTSVLLGSTLYYGTASADTVKTPVEAAPANASEREVKTLQPYAASAGSSASAQSAAANSNVSSANNDAQSASLSTVDGKSAISASSSVNVQSSTEKVQTMNINANAQPADLTAGLTDSKLAVNDQKTITRTINVTTPDGKQNATTQSVTFKYDGKTWNSNNNVLPSYMLPKVAGYSPVADPDEIEDGAIESITADPYMPNLTVNVTYQKQDGSWTINYVDENKNLITSKSYSGKYQDQVTVNYDGYPDGYKLVDGQSASEKLTINGDQEKDVAITPVVVTVTPTNPGSVDKVIPGTKSIHYPSTANLNYLQTTVKRTLELTGADGQIATVDGGSVTFSRNAVVNAVTGQVTYGDWDQSSKTLPAMQVDVPAGYSYVGSSLGSRVITPESGDLVLKGSLVKVAKSFNVIIEGPREFGVIDSRPVSGGIGDTVKLDLSMPYGFKLASDQTLPSASYTFKDTNPDLVIKVVPITFTVTHDAPKTSSDTLPDESFGKETYPNGLSQDDLNRTVTRTIKITDPTTGRTTSQVQTVAIYRDATYTPVTGDITYTNWSTAQFAAVTLPTYAGYATNETVSVVDVNANTKDQTVDVTYYATDRTGRVELVNANNQVVAHVDINGRTGGTYNVDLAVPFGYQLVSGQVIPSSMTLAGDGNNLVQVKVEPKIYTFDANNTHQAGELIKDGGGLSYPAGVSDADLSKTITRTINLHLPNGHVTPVKQVAKLTRLAYADLINGKVSYGVWSTGNWDVYTVPTESGYSPSQPVVDVQAVDVNSQDTTVDVDYVADGQTFNIVYEDVNGHAGVLKTVPVTGATDQIIDLSGILPPAGWVVVGNNHPNSYTFKATGNSDVVINVKHGSITIDPGKADPSGNLPDNPNQKYPDGLTANDLNKYITRTITVNDPHAKDPRVIKQQAHVSRNATVDEVTNQVTYGDWSVDDTSWAAISDLPIAGYTMFVDNQEGNQIASQKVDVNTKDTNLIVTYAANAQTGKISYVDANGNEVGHTDLSGVTDASIVINPTAPAGWVIDNGQHLPKTVIAGANGIPMVTVEVSHEIVSVDPSASHHAGEPIDPKNPNGPKYPSGLEETDLNKTITRTINVNDPHQQKQPVVQSVTLHRTASFDAVTGKVTYGDWSTDQFKEFVIPPVAGYTAKQTKVDAENVTADTKDQTIEIDYVANPQTGKIVYVDANGKEIGHTDLTGVTDGDVAINPVAPDGWKITAGQHVISSEKATANGIPTVKVVVEHEIVNVDPNVAHHAGEPIDPKNPDGPKYPSGLEDTDLNKTVTRTIVVNDPHQGKSTITQQAKLHRAGYYDLATKQVSYGDWSLGHFDQYQVPQVAGYTSNLQEVASQQVNGGTKDVTVTINYTADQQHGKISYVDATGKEIGHTDLTGVTDANVTVKPVVPINWTEVTGQQVPKTVKATADGIPTVTIKVEHATVNVDPNTGHQPGDPVDPKNPSGPKYPAGLTDQDLNKTIVRTILIHDPHHGLQTKNQVVELHRSGSLDLVTMKPVYGAWNTGKWAEFDVSAVAGYTASQSKIDESNVTADTKDQTVEIGYQANQQTGKIVYVDAAGNEIGHTDLSGVTDQEVDVFVKAKAPAGWTFTKDSHIPGFVTATADGIPTIKVVVEHNILNINPSYPHHVGDPIDPKNPDGPKYPGGLEESDLNKTITRTIIVNDPVRGQQKVMQKVQLRRTAKVDMVTGKLLGYSDWSTGEWQAYAVPTVAGYTAKQLKIDAAKVTGETKDQTVTVNYTANDQQVVVNLNDQGKAVQAITVKGKTGQTVDLKDQLPKGYQLVNGQDGHYTFTAKSDQAITVKVLRHNIDASTVPGADLSRTITRTVLITSPDGTKKTMKQTVMFTRTGTYDEVTKQFSYGAWDHNGQQSFAAVSQPDLKGYDKTGHADAMMVTPDTKSSTVNLGYQKQADIKVDPSKPSTWPKGLTKDDLSKTITRTITIKTPTGEPKVIKQTVIFTRSATVDPVTDEVTYGPWSENGKHLFPLVDVPNVPGYQSDIQQIPAVEVTPDTDVDQLASDVTVNYQAKDQQVIIKYTAANGQVISQQAVNGKTGEVIKPKLSAPAGYQVDPNFLWAGYQVTSDTDQTIKVPVVKTVPAGNDATQDGKLATSDNDKSGSVNGFGSLRAGQANSQVASLDGGLSLNGSLQSGINKIGGRTKSNQQDTLPQTGDHEDYALVALGMSALVIGLGLMKKREM